MNFEMIDKRRLVSYFQATSNETAVDILSYKMLNVTPEAGNYVPRPTKLLKYSKKKFIKLLKIFWIYFLGYTLFLKQLFSYLVKQIKMKKPQGLANNKTVAVAFSDRTFHLINEKNCNALPDYWIVFPWSNCSHLDKVSTKINILSLITAKELWKAYYFSICAHRTMSKRLKYKNWILQSYTAFEWFVTRIALEKIKADFFITQHYDRWAVMMDGIMMEHERTNLNSSLTLVQHGLVGDISGDRLLLPYKLSKIKRLYLFEKSAEDYFRKNILAKNIDKTLEDVRFYNNLLSLTKLPPTDKINILFVGHSICADLHIYILNTLMLKYDLLAYYKPHPAEKTSNTVYTQKWTIIEDKLFFPEVDLLISYPSTLVNEYEHLGIKSVVHPISLKTDSIQGYLEELEREIELCYNKKYKFEKNIG